MLFGSKSITNLNNSFQITIGGGAIDRVSSTKCLGVYIDEKLQWNLHINSVALSIAKALGV